MSAWEKVLDYLKNEVNEDYYQTWISPLRFIGNDGESIYLKVPNRFFKESLENKLGEKIRAGIKEAFKENLKIKYIYQEEEISEPQNFTSINYNRTNLNSRYTFNNFVVGTCNQFAHAASIAVANSPGKAYNPLFIYGGSGLGKTHLMNAIGNYIYSNNSNLNIFYVTIENFMNDLIHHLHYGKIMEFRKKYRGMDVLLIDDIQFLAGKERTKEEFFHTFNYLYEAQKQVVLTSDCHPKYIPNLEERLHSRFEWGLIVDLKPPDLETKLAILNKKCEENGLKLPHNISLFIASKVKSDIRQLEGALIRLKAYASMKNEPIDLTLTKEALKNILDFIDKQVTPDMIMKFVAEKFNIKIIDLKSKNNSPKVAFPRQIAMYLLKELTSLSLPEIGKEFGNKHHTTVLYAIQKIGDLRNKDEEFDKLIEGYINFFRYE
ncbi:MAG: chromosomal replication initiator protein DnaA [Candidatus Aminicenantia bacterium]